MSNYEVIPLQNISTKKHNRLQLQKKMFAFYKNTLGGQKETARRLYKLCIESLKSLLNRIDESIDKKDVTELSFTFHKLKVVLGSSGLHELMEDAKILCSHTNNIDRDGMGNMHQELSDAITRFKKPIILLCENNND